VTSAYFEQLDELMATNGVTLDDFKAYLTWHLVYQNSGVRHCLATQVLRNR
jgi:hypothetical protein